MMLCGIGSRRHRTLGHDHDEAGSGDRQQFANKLPIRLGDRKMRQSACDRTDHLDSVACEIKCCAGCHRSYQGEERPREPRHEAVGKQHK